MAFPTWGWLTWTLGRIKTGLSDVSRGRCVLAPPRSSPRQFRTRSGAFPRSGRLVVIPPLAETALGLLGEGGGADGLRPALGPFSELLVGGLGVAGRVVDRDVAVAVGREARAVAAHIGGVEGCGFHFCMFFLVSLDSLPPTI